jgi:uncharacterized DUF497 family protein
MELTWRPEKEQSIIRKHGLDFSLARQIFADPLSDTKWNGVVNRDERRSTIGIATVAGRRMTVVVIHTYPDPEDDTRIHVISLREATAHERRHYEVSRF